MAKKLLLILFLLFFSISLTFGAEVRILSEVYKDKTNFEYKFLFNENDSLSSFSIEKPKESIITSFPSEELSYSVAGDFYIFKVMEDSKNKEFVIEFTSVDTSRKILDTGSFSTYLNFNFEIESLEFSLDLKDNFSEIIEIFPRDYIITQQGNYVWSFNETPQDLLILVNFKQDNGTDSNILTLGLLLIIPVIFFIFLIFIIRKLSHTDEDHKDDNSLEKKQESKEKEEKIDEKKFEEIKEKYLTDNEKEVLDIIKQNEGISQNDILNHLPKLTKSNLSKIISKLHARKILNRIKVGKVNKIYLGERLEPTPEPEKKDKTKES